METEEPASNQVVEEPGSDEMVEEPASDEVEAEQMEASLKQNKRFEKLRKRLMKDAKKAQNKGVCYLSRIPPKMDPLKLRHLLSPLGEVLRIYLVPEDPDSGRRRKQSGGFRGQGFSEGWVEFSDKRVAKRVANMLNEEQIGGKKRSKIYYDIWNIKYLSKFKWDDLTDENARKNAAREEKLRMELVAAKKEKDFYISKVEMSRALSEVEERMKKGVKMPKKNFSKVSTETKPESSTKQQNLPKKTREVDVKRKKPETEKSVEPSNRPKKATLKKSDEIDEIFAALKRRKTEQAKAEKSGDTRDKVKTKKKSKLANESETFNTNSNPRRRTNDGFVIYSVEELGINKKDAGQTALCPFDCSCCF